MFLTSRSFLFCPYVSDFNRNLRGGYWVLSLLDSSGDIIVYKYVRKYKFTLCSVSLIILDEIHLIKL